VSKAVVVEEACAVAARREGVWRSIVESGRRSRWWPDLEMEVTPGGRVLERWADGDGALQPTQGEVVCVVEGQLLHLKWPTRDGRLPQTSNFGLRTPTAPPMS